MPKPSKTKAERTGEALNALIVRQAAWSQTTFGSDRTRGPIGPLKHIKKEVNEAVLSYKKGYAFTEEFADILLLLLDASRRAGLEFFELVAAAEYKQTENERRTWPTVIEEDKPVEHIREGKS